MPSQKSSETKRTTKKPQRRRGRDRVSALLRAGVEVFSEAGYDAATMTQIAERAGASIGSLYQYFPTKEHLGAEIHGQNLDALARMLTGLVDEAGVCSLDVMVDRLFAGLMAFLEENPAFVVLAERRTMDAAVKKRARARLRERVAALLAATTPPVDPGRRAELAAVTLSLIRVAAMLNIDDDETIRDGAVTELRAMLKAHLVGASAPSKR